MAKQSPQWNSTNLNRHNEYNQEVWHLIAEIKVNYSTKCVVFFNSFSYRLTHTKCKHFNTVTLYAKLSFNHIESSKVCVLSNQIIQE